MEPLSIYHMHRVYVTMAADTKEIIYRDSRDQWYSDFRFVIDYAKIIQQIY